MAGSCTDVFPSSGCNNTSSRNNQIESRFIATIYGHGSIPAGDNMSNPETMADYIPAGFGSNSTTDDMLLYTGAGVNRVHLSKTVVNCYIWFIYIIPFLGIVFNGLSIAVFLQRRLSKAVVSSFLIASCACDTLAMTFIFYIAYVRHGWWPLTDFGCKLSVYMTSVGRMSSVWMTVCYTAERLLSIKYIFRQSPVVSKCTAYVIICVVIAIMLVEQSFTWVWIQKIPPGFCFTWDKQIQKQYFLTLLIMNRLVNFLIPLISVATMNALIVYTVRKSGKMKGMRRSVRSRRKICNKHKLTTMLVLVSSIQFVLLIPETTSKVMELITDFNQDWVTAFTLLADALSYISHSCNFFFYVISGVEFRKDFVDMICCRQFGGLRRNKFSATSYTSQSAIIIISTVAMVSFRNTHVTCDV